jgi:hypothetical protein
LSLLCGLAVCAHVAGTNDQTMAKIIPVDSSALLRQKNRRALFDGLGLHIRNGNSKDWSSMFQAHGVIKQLTAPSSKPIFAKRRK